MRRHRRRSRADATGRSDREQRFFMLRYNMALSPAWRSLSGAAVKVFTELRCHFNGRNNGELFLSYRDAGGRLGLGRSTVKRAFDELEAKGFIRKTRQGARHCRLASMWAVTDAALKEGEPPTNDWRRWYPQKNKTSVPIRNTQIPDGAAMGPV